MQEQRAKSKELRAKLKLTKASFSMVDSSFRCNNLSMRLRQRRSGKVASGKRAARGHWTSEKEKGARQGRAEYQACRYLPAPVRGAIQLGRRIQWPRAARLPLATILPRLPARGNHNGNRLGFAS